MAKDSGIQWTTHTFNPWWGCEKVSEACKHCYAESFAKRVGEKVWGGDDSARRFFGDKHWAEPLKWAKAAEKAGERHRVFCASMADVFEDRRDLDSARTRLWDLIEATPMLDWLLLSKRWGTEDIEGMVPRAWAGGWPANVWAGSTVENQPRAEQRLPHLLRVPAVVRYLSVEPMLGPVDLSPWLTTIGAPGDAMLPERALHWVIIGGESGHHARPFDLHYARDLSAQCVEAGVPVFWKQLGAYPIIRCSPDEANQQRIRIVERLDDVGARIMCQGWRVSLRDSHGGDVSEWPADLQVPELRRWPR